MYDFGSLEIQVDVLKTLIDSNLEDMDAKQTETTNRAKLGMYMALWEVVREVEQEELDEGRECINAINILEDEEEIKNIIDDYGLNADWNWCGWYISNKLGLSHIDELFLVEYIENEKMHFVIQDGQDFDLCEPYVLE